MEALLHVLITAGATRNPLDAVRYLSAHATGRTGVYLGTQLLARGATVHLLGSPEACLRAPGLTTEVYESTDDLGERMRRWIVAHPAGHVVHSAAVGDYALAGSAQGKLPSGQAELVLRLVPTPKLADSVRAWGCAGTFVTFKAAAPGTTPEQLEAIAKAQRARTGSDWVFANVLGRLGSQVMLVGEQTRRFAERQPGLDALVAMVLAE